MTLSDFYLICFLVGFGLSVIAVLSGTHHLHLPGMRHGHIGHGFGGYIHSVFGIGNIAAFLAWFGGVGYLLTRFSGLWLWFALFLAVAGGLLGGAIVFWFSMKLMARERPLDPADYDMIGVLGKLTSAIREGGVGEIGFSQEGTRRSAPARSEDGHAILKGSEVLVTRYERGIAFVRRWEDMEDMNDANKETL